MRSCAEDGRRLGIESGLRPLPPTPHRRPMETHGDPWGPWGPLKIRDFQGFIDFFIYYGVSGPQNWFHDVPGPPGINSALTNPQNAGPSTSFLIFTKNPDFFFRNPISTSVAELNT